MLKSTTFTLLLGLGVLGACSKTQGPGSAPVAPPSAGTTAPAAKNPAAPVAKIGTEVITEGDLQAATAKQLSALEADHAEKVYETRSQGLDQLIEKKLIEAKAKASGVTPEALIAKEVTAKVPEPAAAEVQMVYDQTKASGRPLPPFDQVKPDIVRFLKQRKEQEAREAFITSLKSEAKVEKLLAPPLPPKVNVAADGPSKGEASAPVTIVEFSDFQCPFCSRAEATVKQVMDSYKGKVRLVFRDFPLPFHAEAQKASEAALCAGDQNKYWEMHEKLFANQSALGVPQLKEHAKTLGLDQGKFDKCLDSGEKAKLVENSKKAGEEAGVSGTPAFFINGRMISGAQPFEKFKAIIDAELAGG